MTDLKPDISTEFTITEPKPIYTITVTAPKPLTPHQLAVIHDMQAGWILSEGLRHGVRPCFETINPADRSRYSSRPVRQATFAALLAHKLIERGAKISDGHPQHDIDKPWLLTAKGKEWADACSAKGKDWE
jgi:hypothetical protein